MLIDWFTVGAQIVNFLILVWLLKRFLYRPFLAAIDAREKEMARIRAEVMTDQKKAKEDRDQLRHQTESTEKEHLALRQAAETEAAAERTRLLHEANSEAEQLRVTRRKALENEIAQSRAALLRLTREEIIALTRKIVLDLTSEDLERASLEVFLRRLEESPTHEGPSFGGQDPSASAAGQAILRSPFALSLDQQEQVQRETDKKFHSTQRLDFAVDPNLGLGLELTIHDEKIAWSVDSYLSSFETHLAEFTADKKS